MTFSRKGKFIVKYLQLNKIMSIKQWFKSKKYILVPLILIFLLIPMLVTANGMGEDIAILIYFLFFIGLIVEIIVFWLLANKLFKIEISFLKSLLIVIVANIASGIFFVLLKMFFSGISRSASLFTSSAFILITIIEFGIYSLFFMKSEVKKSKLLILAFIVNLVYLIGVFSLF